ncbi:hypothetical protein VTK73DRAFT_3515 [Phialemonium thermophilum]|uniref:FAD linked oxidase N-terminal domain-containing protein n=1 Tax=Phialemonium thermophilum TaxID=223376 RepID=A0ABR3VIW8_9PEZI
MLDVLRFLVPAAIAAAGVQGANHSCKNIPGDPGWPSASSWAALNKTVGGRLIATVPAASVCHKKPYHDYNETACDDLKTVWDFPQAHFTYPSEIGSAWFQNGSCDPFTPASQPCRLGNYASYSINVTGAADVVAGVQFAKKNNVRLVIKNTGSDVLGRSTGKGSLLLWTFNLKTTQILPSYSASYYQGPAIRIGAGIMVEEAMAAATRP